MEATIFSQLMSIYQPGFNLKSPPKKSNSFSIQQTNEATSYMQDSYTSLDDLVTTLKPDIHETITTCLDILEMSTKVPSVSIIGDKVNMSAKVCASIHSIAEMAESYYDDPLSVNIQKECGVLSLAVQNRLNKHNQS